MLTDPSRRQRYDAYRRATRTGCRPAQRACGILPRMLGRSGHRDLDVLSQTTELNIGNPFRCKLSRESGWPVGSASGLKQPAAPPPVSALKHRRVIRPRDHGAGRTIRASGHDRASTGCRAEARSGASRTRARLEAPVPTPPLNDVVAIAERFGLDGRFLHAVRELRKRTLDALVEETRISMRYIHAIESNDFDALPAETLCGYELARALEIHEVDVVEGYLALYRQHRG